MTEAEVMAYLGTTVPNLCPPGHVAGHGACPSTLGACRCWCHAVYGDPPAMGLWAVAEGECPYGHGPLTPTPALVRFSHEPESAGSCDTCQVGWLLRGGEVLRAVRVDAHHPRRPCDYITIDGARCGHVNWHVKRSEPLPPIPRPEGR